MDRQTILVSAYPKSGSTWLTRLLGDVLDSPTGGSTPAEDRKEVATEGQDRPGPFIVRKGHFVLADSIFENDNGQVVPLSHRLSWRKVTDEKIVFLIRDPRDICISGAYHWGQPVETFLDRMIRGDIARCGRWDKYCDQWLDMLSTLLRTENQVALAQYERLIADDADYYLSIKLNGMNAAVSMDQIRLALQRQSFAARKARIGDNERELRRNNMRKGVAGDWRNHFTPAMNERIWNEFGWMMGRLGYTR